MRKVKLEEVCKRIYAGGDVPKDRFSETKTEEYAIPIYANAEKEEGLYGYTDLARENELSITVAARGTIGYTAIRREPFLPVVRLITVVPDTDIVSERYLYYALKNCKPQSSGTSIPQLTVPDIKKNSIFLYDLKRQNHIADILDKVNVAIDYRKRELDKLDELVKARFVELFGDPELNEKGWIQGRLGDYCRVINGRAYKAEELLSSGKYKVLRVGNFFTSENWYYSDLELESDKYCDFGDLLFAWSASFGPKIWDGDKTIYHYHIWKLDDYTENLNKNFFVEHLNYNCEIMKRSTHGSTMAHFTKGQMEDQVMVIPPMELQNQFAAFVEQVDKSKVAIQKSLDEMQVLYDKLMQEYFG